MVIYENTIAMKKIIFMLLAAGFFTACSNQSGETDQNRDTIQRDQNMPADTAGRGDTASYERMPTKPDSTRK